VATFSARKSISIYWTIIVVNDIDVTKDRTLKEADAAMEPAAARTKMVASVARQALPSRKTQRKRKKEKKRIEQITWITYIQITFNRGTVRITIMMLLLLLLLLLLLYYCY